jgi:enoyl-CoA hydratase/carnithine racemase
MDTKYEVMTVELEHRLTLMTLNRPAVQNELHAGAPAALEGACKQFERDDRQWVAIITGSWKRA